MSEVWRIEELNGIFLVRCLALLEVPGVAHAFSTRRGDGAAGFDLGGSAGPRDPYSEERRRRFCKAAGLAGMTPVRVRQVHGNRVIRVGATSAGRTERADAIFALRGDARDPVPAVRVADCVPIVLVESGGRAVAAIHAGWRGTAAAIARATVETLARLDIEPRRLLAALGPAIGSCCYEVGSDVAGEVARASGVPDAELCEPAAGGRRGLDLRRANRIQLERAGVPPSSIHMAPWCTACETELFFSHRRDGRAAGRQMACVGWRSLTPALA